MKEYIEKWDALMQLTGINLPEDTCSYIGIVDRRIYNLPPANVVERSKIDKAIEEIEQTLYVDSLIFGELFDFKDGKISADDVIEEFNRVTRLEVLKILDKYKAESEG